MEIQRVDDISLDEFRTRFHDAGVPVVFKSAARVWKANGLFTPEWFRQNFGDRKRTIQGKTYTMREIMDLVESSTVENPAPYPITFDVETTMPELLPLIEPLNLHYAAPNWLDRKVFHVGKWGGITQVFIGGPGGQFPYAHIDLFHLSAWITQLYGQKRFTVFPRDQGDLLYPKPGEPWKSDVNIFNPDFEKHPKYKNATPLTFTVGPGETLYIPFGMWHTAYSLTPTISVAFDQLNRKNYPKFLSDVWVLKKRGGGTLKAMAMYSYALAAAQACKLADIVSPQS